MITLAALFLSSAHADELVVLTDPTRNTPASAETLDAAAAQKVKAKFAGRENFGELEIVSVAKGAFTEAGKSERVALVMGELISMAEGLAAALVVVDSAGVVSVRDLGPSGGMSVSMTAVDYDKDGTVELWIEAGGSQMGQTWTSGKLLTLASGEQPRTIFETPLYQDNCMGELEGQTQTLAARVVSVAGVLQAFDVRWYKGTCDGGQASLKPVVP